ncbi:MAG: S1/P1 nuclease [Opitutae bacterium]|nr:S1/P1 nuclease [Opitutae bacterium]
MNGITRALTILLLSAVPAVAWNSLGHRMVAELAWRQMDAAERAAATELLKQHPHYESILVAQMPAGVSKDEGVFLTAAIWPDLVRPVKGEKPPKPESVTKYNVIPHGVGLPLVLAANQGKVSLDSYVIATPNAQTGLAESIATLNNPQASVHDRAISLCWVLHLSGDLHQPLHAATLVSPEKPQGSGFGSPLNVPDESGKPVNYHAFWDGLLGQGGGDYAAIAAQTDVLQKSPELAPAKFSELKSATTVPAWAAESRGVAERFAYGAAGFPYAQGPDIVAGKIPAYASLTLKPGYLEKSRAMAHRQLALAGWRLTEVLKHVW